MPLPRFKSANLAACPGLWRKAAVWAAVGGGLGLSPVASGTFGTLPGVAIAIGLAQCSLPWTIGIAALLPLLAIPLCEVAERHFGTKDDRRIVADEYLTFPLCMLGLPLQPWLIAAAFLTHRAFDVLKPPPARGLQALHGGFGIVIDDVIASLYALAANHALYWAACRWLA